MMNALRTEYVNPKAVMCQNNQMNSANVNTEEENEKKQRSLEGKEIYTKLAAAFESHIQRQRGFGRKYQVAGKAA